MENLIEKCKKHKRLIIFIFLTILFIYYLTWVVQQPFNTGPDEHMKYDICEYIYKYWKLPKGDDAEIRDSIWGISYAFQPILSYMISAVFMRIMSLFSTKAFMLVVAARLVSTLSMTGFIYFCIKISQKLFKGIYKYLFIAFIAFLPQIAFLASYINNDSIALFAISIIIYIWLLGLESNWKTKHCIYLGLAIGFCVLTYYNAYGYILCSIILCLTSTIMNKTKPKEIAKKAFIVFIIAFLVAGWWFIRNAIIYDGDFLGINAQTQCGDKYALDKYKPSSRKTLSNSGTTLWEMLFVVGWVKSTIKSYIGTFGYMSINMPNAIYGLHLLIVGIASMGCIINIRKLLKWNKNEKNKYLIRYIFILAIIITISLSIIYSYASDYQPQGRYIMPMIIPFAYYIVYGIKVLVENFVKNEKLKKIIVIALILILLYMTLYALFGCVIPKYRSVIK